MEIMTNTRNLKGMAKFKAIMNGTRNDNLYWGGPLWRRTIVFMAMIVALGAFAWVTSDKAHGSEPTPRVRSCSASDPCFGIAKPAVMAKRFRHGVYGNSKGVVLPAWFHKKAVAYYMAHPSRLPASARTAPTHGGVMMRRDINWDFLNWTETALTATRCVGYAWHPIGWWGCSDIPPWEKKPRMIMRCGGAVAIMAIAVGAAPVAAQEVAIGTGFAGCFYGMFQ